MSKNDHMRSEPQTVGALRTTVGAAATIQGVYGTHGNLELLACDERDGLWVFWFNSDAPGSAPSGGVQPGRWSEGLAFARGMRFVQAQILQSALGPDHLEVLALDARGTLQSWYWAPEAGFRRRATDVGQGVRRFAAEHDDGVLRVVVDADSISTRVSDATGYPVRSWRQRAATPWERASLELGAHAHETLVRAGVDEREITPGTARSARSTRDGGTDELTWRGTDGVLRHVGVPWGA